MNLRGEVIGVNSALLSQSGGFEGVGFAIPSNMAVHVANTLINTAKWNGGWLGVSVQDVPPDLAKSLDLEILQGTVITDLTKDGAADNASFKKGDVVLLYQGKDIPDAAALRNDVANSPVDQEVNVSVWRDGNRHDFRVKTGNLEELTKILTTSLKQKLGVEARPMTVQEAEQYGIRAPEGVVIRWIDSKAPLGKVGFEVGEISFWRSTGTLSKT